MLQSPSHLCSDSSPDNSEMPVAQLTAEGHSHSELRTEPELGLEMLVQDVTHGRRYLTPRACLRLPGDVCAERRKACGGLSPGQALSTLRNPAEGLCASSTVEESFTDVAFEEQSERKVGRKRMCQWLQNRNHKFAVQMRLMAVPRGPGEAWRGLGREMRTAMGVFRREVI